jgi:hypothetical protein
VIGFDRQDGDGDAEELDELGDAEGAAEEEAAGAAEEEATGAAETAGLGVAPELQAARPAMVPTRDRVRRRRLSIRHLGCWHCGPSQLGGAGLRIRRGPSTARQHAPPR